MGGREWGRARALAAQLAAERDTVRGFSEAIAGAAPDADAAMRELDEMIAELRGALGSDPVDSRVVAAKATVLRRRLP